MENEAVENNLVLNDYPIKQQSKMLGEKEILKNLEILEKLYLCGGEAFFAGTVKEENFNVNLEENEIVYQLGDTPKLYALKIRAKSRILSKILSELLKQNLISLRGEKKENLLDEIVLRNFLLSGYPVRLI